MHRLNLYLSEGEREALFQLKRPAIWGHESYNGTIYRLLAHYNKHAEQLASGLSNLKITELERQTNRTPLTLRLYPDGHLALQSIAQKFGLSQTDAIRILIWWHCEEQAAYMKTHTLPFSDFLAFDENRPHPWYSHILETEAYWKTDRERNRIALEKKLRAEGWSDNEIALHLTPAPTPDPDTFDGDTAATTYTNPTKKDKAPAPATPPTFKVNWAVVTQVLGFIVLVGLAAAMVLFGAYNLRLIQ